MKRKSSIRRFEDKFKAALLANDKAAFQALMEKHPVYFRRMYRNYVRKTKGAKT